ncbi:MAG: LCP family protein [Blautia sp.]|nr:LCP family protein [Blautia sp.]
MRRLREPSPKLNNALFFLAGVMTVVLVFILVAGVQTKAQQGGRAYGGEPAPATERVEPGPVQEETLEKWQEGVIEYKGKSYRYNSNLRTYLIMGVDSDDPVEEAKDGVSGGQSDAMFLLVADSEKRQLSVISINRNTMTDIDIYDEEGYSLGSLQGQICLQHSFGDGRKLSCSRSADVVAELFGNIPVSGYIALNMGGIPLMNNAVGGVEVTVLADIHDPARGVELCEGDTVTLSGEEAYSYLKSRDVTEFDSASQRLRREEQYIIGYMDKLREMAGDNTSMVEGVYDSVADYLVTSVNFTNLLTELTSYTFDEEHLYTVPGETVMGEELEEYYVEEEAFADLIYEVFYIPL